MSRRLPPVSGRQLIRLLERLGYEVLRQRGSHVRLRNSTNLGEHNITVPAHREIAVGTLNDILNEVALWNNMPKPRLVEMFQDL